MNGFLIVDKPKGITSLSVCNRLKHRLGLNKAGHNGTLDPDATGVLVVACDKATKLVRLINEHDKEYIATIVFGYDSDTWDMDGNITRDIKMDVNIEAIKEKMAILKERSTQIPPMTSAIKVDGKKLYEYQRKGIEIERKPRPIKIYESEIASKLRYNNGHYEIDIRLFVSKGFYVRSYAHDLGELLGGVAILSALRRTRAGEYKVAMAKPMDDIVESDIIPIEKFFDLPRVEINDYISGLVMNGITLDNRQTNIKGVFYVCNNSKIIAIYEYIEDNKYKPILIFK